MIFIKLFLFLFWTILIPYFIGRLFFVGEKTYKGAENLVLPLLVGIGTVFFFFQIFTLPMIYFKVSQTNLTIIIGGFLLILALVSIVINRPKIKGIKFGRNEGFHVYFYIACAIIIFQILVCAFYMHIDQDDAFYIGTASTDLKTNSIYRYDPYTGYEYKLLPSRYVLSPFPVYLSFISRLIGMHPLSVAHTLFPIVFISMSYMAYYLIGGELLGDSKRDKGVFLLFISLIQMCSFYSVYTQGTFLLLRIWQGKSILANLILPMIFYLAIRTFREMGQKKEWVMLFCYMGAASFVSSMGIMLAPIELGIFMMIYGVLGGQWHKVPKGILCCSVNIICGIVYILIR